MTKSIEREIVLIVSEVSETDEKEITLDMDFLKDLKIDSIKAIEIVVAIEKKFKVSVRDDDVPRIRTVRDAIDLVNQLVKQGSSVNVKQ
jgi:acyl carrier protein